MLLMLLPWSRSLSVLIDWEDMLSPNLAGSEIKSGSIRSRRGFWGDDVLHFPNGRLSSATLCSGGAFKAESDPAGCRTSGGGGDVVGCNGVASAGLSIAIGCPALSGLFLLSVWKRRSNGVSGSACRGISDAILFSACLTVLPPPGDDDSTKWRSNSCRCLAICWSNESNSCWRLSWIWFWGRTLSPSWQEITSSIFCWRW